MPEQTQITSEWLRVAQEALQHEAAAIQIIASRLGESFLQAVELILNHPGKVVVTAVGKSGHIGNKITATLCSTGTPAVFLHAAEAIHGDLGVYSHGDLTILISKSGSTSELIRLVPILRQRRSQLIAIVGNLDSPLAREADIVLDARVEREADPLSLVPTSSSMAALAMGDALASALIYARRFTEDDFAVFHPGGQLGRNLILKVKDVMHTKAKTAWLNPEASFKAAVIAMTEHPLGAACVVDENNHLLGIITEGDVRRTLTDHDDIRPLKAVDIMKHSPITVAPSASLRDALQLMEDRPSQISVLPVVNPMDGCCLGLVRLHDIYQPHFV